MNYDAHIQSTMFDEPRITTRAGRKAAARHQRKEAKLRATHHRDVLQARNPAQAEYLEALQNSDQVFAVGPAGTGKTYLAARVAIRMVLDGVKEKVCVARATAAKKKHQLGFRPGSQAEKVADWMIPVLDGFKAEASASAIDSMTRAGKIEFLAFETLQGRSLPNSFVILDEAQNCDLDDLRLFLTRIGENSVVVVSGDITQVDISGVTNSGLEQVLDMIDDFDMDVEVIEFTEDDVVRSETAKAWVKAFARLTA